MSSDDQVTAQLKGKPKTWLVTGVAGFIGSNLLEALLKLGQTVIGLDNFATGKPENLDEVRTLVGPEHWQRFRFVHGDITDPAVCQAACQGVDFILHQAALGSVPLSMTEPLRCHSSNVTAFVNLLIAAREARVRRLVYASSCAVYGDDPSSPKTEESSGKLLSPYAASKLIDEVYADVFFNAFGLESLGLRYFNIFGPRQDPEGAYAAVIPKWIDALLRRHPVYINGDGETTRDFCYVGNVVQANLLAALVQNAEAINKVYNIGLGQRTTLNELFGLIQSVLRRRDPSLKESQPVHREFRPGDIRHSQADITRAQRLLGYAPTNNIEQGLELAMDWYAKHV